MRRPIPWQGQNLELDEVAAERQTANAIYGIIVSASVMASSKLSTSARLAVAVLVTLIVYWAAERYAAVMGGRIAAANGQRDTPSLRQELTDGWELVTASFVPILVLVGVDLLGAELSTSILAALGCSTVLLFLAGLRIGSRGRLSSVGRWASAIAAGALGLVLIALKVALH